MDCLIALFHLVKLSTNQTGLSVTFLCGHILLESVFLREITVSMGIYSMGIYYWKSLEIS